MEIIAGTLYLIPTPIGNLQDISLRALEVLGKVDRLLAEDTRTTQKLLQHYQIHAKTLESFHAFNEHQKVDFYISELKAGCTIGLVSDAGMPAISDPGFLLSSRALAEGITIDVLPGPTAFVPALIKSGFALHRFVYEGFLPLKKGRKTKMEQMLAENATTVFYESPHRVVKTLEQLAALEAGNRYISVSRELTKKFEETITNDVNTVLNHFKNTAPKGEFVMVLEGKEQYENRSK